MSNKPLLRTTGTLKRYQQVIGNCQEGNGEITYRGEMNSENSAYIADDTLDHKTFVVGSSMFGKNPGNFA